MKLLGKALAFGALGAALALGGCEDKAATEKAAAAKKAQAEAKDREQLFKGKLAHNIECLDALRWQESALKDSNIGDLDIYRSYYRTNLENALGDTVFPAEPPKPALSRGTIDEYLEWSYPVSVETIFAAGTDANGDGTVSAEEHASRGFSIVTACVQEVAEVGQGPLAGPDKTGRMFAIERLRDQLKDKGV